MVNKIQITASDNELYIVAYQWGVSYQIAHIQSGNNKPVNVSIEITSGVYSEPATYNGVAQPLTRENVLSHLLYETHRPDPNPKPQGQSDPIKQWLALSGFHPVHMCLRRVVLLLPGESLCRGNYPIITVSEDCSYTGVQGISYIPYKLQTSETFGVVTVCSCRGLGGTG